MFHSIVAALRVTPVACAILLASCGSTERDGSHGVRGIDAQYGKDSRARTTQVSKQQEFILEDGQLVLPVPILFETGSDVLREESFPALSFVKDYLDAKPAITLLRIEGHTDSDADAAVNQQLSEKRAMSVARWLVGKRIECKRLLPVGFGATKPIASDGSPQSKARNRRIVIAPAAMKGRAIGGTSLDGGGLVAGDPCR